MNSLEVLFTPADFAALKRRNLDDATCVVFDVFRATSSIVAALAHGARAVFPVAEIPEALALRKTHPGALLAGERDGLRIQAGLSGGVEFDMGNSPREFVREKVSGKTIVMTTTNGTRAIRAAAHAHRLLAGSFLNLQATADCISRLRPEHLLIVCSGTFEQAALEDILAAGALCHWVRDAFAEGDVCDAALAAEALYLASGSNLAEAAGKSRNARRLLGNPELKEDVTFCLRRNVFDITATLQPDGSITAGK